LFKASPSGGSRFRPGRGLGEEKKRVVSRRKGSSARHRYGSLRAVKEGEERRGCKKKNFAGIAFFPELETPSGFKKERKGGQKDGRRPGPRIAHQGIPSKTI